METINFYIATNPDDMALITSLYRSSIDGRRWMFEAILDDDTKYNLPKSFTSRSAEVAEVYFKSLGVGMNTIIDDEQFIGYIEDKDTIINYKVANADLFITVEQANLLKKIHKVFKKYLKQSPYLIQDFNEIWEYVLKHINKHDKKRIKDNDEVKQIFKDHITDFTQESLKK